MRVAFVGLIAAVAALTTAARADFVVSGGPVPGGEVVAGVADTGGVATEAPDPLQTSAGATRRRPQSPTFLIAYGFGDQVPLRFAVRQIVPKAVRVRYGPGANPDALVTWKGGQGWNRVLFAAVRPLGLRLVMTHMAVEIRK